MRFAYPDNDRRVTAIILNYYEERQEYGPRIIGELRHSSVPPEKVVLWNNGPAYFGQFRGVDAYIHSSEDHLLGRYAAALLADTPYVFIQDNDLTVGTTTIEALLNVAVARHEFRFDNIVGLSGCMLSDGEHPYSTARSWHNSNPLCRGPLPVDVVLGRCWLAHRSALLPGMKLLLEGVDPGAHADDILFSMAGGGGLVAPYIQGCEITNLDEKGSGLCHEPGHFEERNAFARFMLDRRCGVAVK